MSTWTDYASLVQLGAGLNFAYAGLEVLLEKPLLAILNKNQAMIDRIKTAAQRQQRSEATLPYLVYSRARDLIDITSKVMKLISVLNPYVATLSGFLAAAALVYIAENGQATPTPAGLLIVFSVSFAWFCVTVLVMGLFRFLLSVGVPSSLKSA